MFYRFAKWVTTIVRFFLVDVTYIGQENLPEQGGYIVACNHRSMWDPVLLAQGMRRQINFMGKAELFSNVFLRCLMNLLGVISVERGTGDSNAITRSEEVIRRGGLLGIFPEGTRSPDGKPLRPKSGMALIARATGAGIIPCAVVYEKKTGLHRRPIRVKYGKPIPYEELGFGDDQGTASLKRVSKLVMGRIIDMMELPPEEQS